MKEPEFLKIDTALIDGMMDRVERRHKDGELYEDMYAESVEELLEFDADADMDNISLQRALAFSFAITIALADEYMMSRGWKFNYDDGKWTKQTQSQEKNKE